jgi:site-specific DNA recombinase
MRAAIYARMSTDKQSSASTTDQVASCERFASERGWTIAPRLIVQDSGISGASRHNRQKLLDLIECIDEWDVLLCFDFSRLARDSEDLGWIRNRLRAFKRTAVESSTGLDLFNVGAKVLGIMNEEYLVKLRADTYRGLRGRVERKQFAGGTPYGYKTVANPSGRVDAHGNSIPDGYRLETDAGQGKTVRRIYSLYNRGDSYRSIAHQFNAEGVKPPRPRSQKGKKPAWTVSSVRSLILNPIYKGEYIWGRSEWIKDHETGKRRRYERPESEWIRKFDTSWQIVSEGIWSEAQKQMAQRGGNYPRTNSGAFDGKSKTRAGKSKYMLSGLLECAECGGGFYTVTRGRDYGCGWRRDRGPDVCGNETRIQRADLEDRVLGAIQTNILNPENVLYTVEQALAIIREETARPVDTSADRGRLVSIESELDNLVEQIGKLGHLDAYSRAIAKLESEKSEIDQRLLSAPTPIEFSPKRLRQLVTDRVMDLQETFAGDPTGIRNAMKELLRGRRMTVGPDPERGFRVEGLFEWPLQMQAARPHKETGRLDSVVAGTGFEPATSGL